MEDTIHMHLRENAPTQGMEWTGSICGPGESSYEYGDDDSSYISGGGRIFWSVEHNCRIGVELPSVNDFNICNS
jgi:hypothetical protein